jgi:hypothetical protein
MPTHVVLTRVQLPLPNLNPHDHIVCHIVQGRKIKSANLINVEKNSGFHSEKVKLQYIKKLALGFRDIVTCCRRRNVKRCFSL